MERTNILSTKQKIHFANTLTRTVDLIRIAKREVNELNGKVDPEKELYCYSAILKADAMIERCNIFLQKYQTQLFQKTEQVEMDQNKVFEIADELLHPKEKETSKMKAEQVLQHLKFLEFVKKDWTLSAFQKWYQRRKKMGES